MAKFFTSSQISILSQTTVRLALLVKFEFKSSTIRLWNGNRILDASGQEWQPMHGGGKIDGLQVTGGTVATKVTFTVAGLPATNYDILSKAIDEAAETIQHPVTVYLQLFDNSWQPVGSHIFIWYGFMQVPKITRSPGNSQDGAMQSVSIEAVNTFFNRSRPPFGRYTDRDQKSRYSDDRFLELVPSLQNKSVTWPYF